MTTFSTSAWIGKATYIIRFKDQQMMVVVEGKRPLNWACKQVGHLARACPQKTPGAPSNNNGKNSNTNQTSSTTAEHGDGHGDQEVEWIRVIRKKKKPEIIETTTETTAAKTIKQITSIVETSTAESAAAVAITAKTSTEKNTIKTDSIALNKKKKI